MRDETRARGGLGGGYSAPGGVAATPAAQNAPDAPAGILRARRPERTLGEAEAWRDGVAASGRALRQMARRIRASAKGDATALANASALELHADALAEMEPAA